ncbi:hypothetical protein MHYP_G00140720 [Metynnis hypsauchen]
MYYSVLLQAWSSSAVKPRHAVFTLVPHSAVPIIFHQALALLPFTLKFFELLLHPVDAIPLLTPLWCWHRNRHTML